MNDPQSPKELRFKSGTTILNYINRFSSTEKAVFGVLVIAFVITGLIMIQQVNLHYQVEVPGYGGTLTEGLVGLPRTINPVLAVTDVDRDISSLVYAGLMKYSGGKLIPDIARSYKISPDGRTYTFNLRSDIVFQDGRPLTATDVAFTIDKVGDAGLKSPRRNDWADVTVKIVSPTVIEFTLRQPYAPFLTNTTLGILPKHIWNGIPDDQFAFSKYNIEPIGAGPYKVGTIRRDQSGIPTEYHVDTWMNYFDETPYINSIVFSFFADEEKALEALDQGHIDSLASISSVDAVRLAADTGEPYRILSSPLPRIFGVFMNQNQNAALADKNVRSALNMSVDRAHIVEVALGGYGSPVYGPLPGATTTTNTRSASSSLAAAQTLLEKNGWKKNASGIYEKKGTKSTIPLAFDLYTADTPDLKRAAELVKSDWSKLGADITLKIFESSDLYQNVIRTRKYDALLFGEFVGKDRDLFAFWHSSQRNSPGLNVTLYANSAADKLLEDIRSTTDENISAAKTTQLSNIIIADIPAVFLFTPDFIYAIPKSIHSVRLNTISVPSDRFNSVQDWYMETEKVWQIFKRN